MPKRVSAKQRIRQYLLDHVGEVVNQLQIRDAIGIEVSEWGRRVRELRGEDRWPILTHHDRADLKPGQYILTGLPPGKGAVTFRRSISGKLRAEVLDRNGFTCRMCGLSPGDVDEETGRKVRLHIGHIVDKSLGGRDELSNLRALCSTCNQGAKNIASEKPTSIWLLGQVRRARQEEQRAVLKWLQAKFPEGGAAAAPQRRKQV